ncbi:endonuclease [Phyllobacterium sophorae]|uniref:Endonuclease n=1 Tax=Phyllobacterium sophorae TaxID=1520277 RepID=A0A2P7B6Z7_9HYPH|nr:endonuclease [Phyllobacterium sophorae]
MNLSLAHLTALSLAPPDLVTVAARVGFRSVGLRLIQVTPTSPAYPLMDDPAMFRETRAALKNNGIKLSDIEFVMITPALDTQSLRPFLEAGASLGASNVIVAPYDPDRNRLADRFAQLCELAAGYSMKVVMEFFPWAEIKTLSEADAFVEAVDRPNGAILIDSLHFARSGSSFEELSSVAPERIPFVHICDAPAAHPQSREDLLIQAREERLPPGEGGLELKGFLQHLPAGTPLALEVPMNSYAEAAGPEAVIQRAYDGMVRLAKHTSQK